MSEEKIYGDATGEEIVEEVVETPETEENVAEETVAEEVVSAPQEPAKAPVVAKKGLAKASLTFGILALITTLFFLNYIFGILSLVFGIIYLAKKADVKPKGRAIAGIVCAGLSLVISTTIWVNAYIYFTQTSITDIIDDVIELAGNDAISGTLEELTGGAINKEMLEQLGSGEELVNNMVENMTGGAVNMETIEAFVGGEVSVDRVVNFIGDVKEEDVNAFVEDITTMDQQTMTEILTEFDGEVTYEKLEEKFGKDFDLKDIMEYIEGFKAN